MNDPMMISGFILAHIGMVIIIVGFIFPGWYDALIPVHRRLEGTEPTVPGELKGIEGTAMEDGLRGALGNDAENALTEHSSGEVKPEVKSEAKA
jgi:solute carrier family 6 GABA transporter-like protein 1